MLYFSKHTTDIVNDDRLMQNDILFFTETQIPINENVQTEDFEHFKMFFNNNENKYLSLAYGLHDNITLEGKCDYPGFSIITIKKASFYSLSLTLMLLYKPNRQSISSFCECLNYFVQAMSIDFIAGDFNIDGYQETQIKNILIGYSQLVEEPTHIGGSLLDHVYVRNTILQEFDVNVSILNTYFSDHDAVRIKLSKKEIDFQVIAQFLL